jgi:hypothetical protein
MAANVQRTPPYADVPKVVCALRLIGSPRGFDIDATGTRILAQAPVENPNLITVLTNWRR